MFDSCGGFETLAIQFTPSITFTSDGTSTYFIMIEGIGNQSGDFNLEVTCEVAFPDNNECVDATPLVCREAVTGDTSQATNSGGNSSPDVWYSFTGLEGITQEVTASLCGSSFDTVLRVFDACDGNEITLNDDSCGAQSELTFTSDGTSTYLILVEGSGSNAGEFTLELSCSPDDPINYDNCLDAVDINCGDTFVGETITATDSNTSFGGDVFFSFTGEGVMQEITVSLCNDITDFDTELLILDECGGNIIAENDDFCGDQSQLTFTSDGTSRYIIMVDGGFFASGNFSLSISCSPGDPGSNDNCEDAAPVGCGNNVILGDTSIGTDTGGNAAPDLWYSFTGNGNDQDVTLSLCDGGTDFDSVIKVFDECGGTEIAVNDDACGLQSELTFTSEGTSTYLIMIEGSGSSAGAFSLAVSSIACPVPCENPILEINQDAGDACLAFLFQADVIQSYQPVEAISSGAGFQFLSAPTAGTNLTLTLYDALPSDGGVALTSGTAVADGTAVWLDVSWTVASVVPGDTYFIGLTGTAGQCVSGSTSDLYPGGNFFVGGNPSPDADLIFRTYSCKALDAIANDDCSDAIPVDCGVTVTGSTLDATDSGGNAAPDLWYSFTGNGNDQDVTLSLCDGGTDFDSVIRVFDECGGTEIAANDDACGLQSELTFTSEGASTYLIMIEGSGSSAGAFSLAVSCVVLGDSCDDSSLEINQDFGDACIANISQGAITQSYQPFEAESSGAGFQFTNPPTAGTNLTLTLYDALPSNAGVALASGTAVADGTAVWLDVFWPITDVVLGDTYFIGVTGSANQCLNGVLSDVYSGGKAFVGGNTFPNFDFTFRTYSCNSTGGVVNDDCTDAIAVDCGETVTGNTTDATDSRGEPSGDVFYSFTGTGIQEEVTLSLCDGGTDYDSILYVFDDSCGSLNEIAFNDDFCGTRSEVTFISDGTTTYTIMVEGFESNTGDFSMSVSCGNLGIDDIDFSQFNYYPNPVNETINFSSQVNIDSITIYNILGQQVVAQSVNAISGQLNVSNLRTGIYFMKVSVGSKSKTYKVIKR
ncbi:secreted protein with Por secretion system C-terminal sorting domain [Psychroflexus torquis ATCC 700755]|uniref:Secreted protein with Por secretion system C-terminal sorting domain n=1 Tax=Psychroflexus torquis (strain ATCC 700755 / CIP 106069 / ACAM 623) TaxID=313595 RepID=K4IJX2_PSYTT|nr:T9SS type A sorting domain-containing protein [Psychroflexus torquis]AFU70108.1 secreted protein with Por secretion system C-terminal sorting domain [Psychroflexus torquis ATCC 700755]